MNPVIARLMDDVERHTGEIWVSEPDDIFRLKNGVIESGAGIHGQYFTVMVMLSGEVRALGIHIFSDLLAFARGGEFSLGQLRTMTRKMLAVDLGVIGYFGLPRFGELLQRFHDSLDELESVEQYSALCEKMFILSNRYQLWMHQIFPWKLMCMFPKNTEQKMSGDAQRLRGMKG